MPTQFPELHLLVLKETRKIIRSLNTDKKIQPTEHDKSEQKIKPYWQKKIIKYLQIIGLGQNIKIGLEIAI